MREAAEALRLTAQDLKRLGVIDRVIKEPRGGAQRGRAAAMKSVGTEIDEMLAELSKLSPEEIRADRRRKFMEIGGKGLAA